MAEPTTQLGDYQLLEKIAQGGMAQVFKAKTVDPNGIERLVVVKRILPHISSDPEYISMLIDEAKIAVNFNHGNIAQIYDLGRVGSDYFIAMEYVDGKTIGQIVREFKEREKPIPIEVIAYCISELCWGLDYIHHKKGVDGQDLGVVHRDISPQNIIVSYSGTVKLIDFGVSKAMDKLSVTESGVLKGKFAYMSPEQAEGDIIDNRSDIFSVGVLLWELLTQERLFKRKTNQETLKAVKSATFVPPSKYRKDIPADLERIVEKALKRRKEQRYHTAGELADDLTRFLLKRYPEFKRLDIAEFLYRYFGPEKDEAGLAPEFPQLEVALEPKPDPVKKEKVLSPIDEEKTEIEYVRNFKKPLLIFLGFLLSVFLGYGAYQQIQKYTQATLKLTVRPADALVVVDHHSVKRSAEYEIKVSPQKEVSVQVNSSGYVPYNTVLVLKRGEVREQEIILTKELPPFGDLRIESNPSGATIFLDDREWERKTPTQIPHLHSDQSYKLRLSLEGYLDNEQLVELEKAEQKTVRVDLVPSYASLHVTSTPSGATVFLDDQEVGKTPYDNEKISPEKSMDLKLSFPGYKEEMNRLILQPNEKKELDFQLKVM